MIQVPLIPRKIFFDNPDRAFVQISPDGQQLAWLAPLEGVLNVWVAARGDLSTARPVTHDRGRGIRFYQWACCNSHLIFEQDRDGDENGHLYSVEIATGQARDLTPFPGAKAQLNHVSHKLPDQIVVGLNNRNAQFHDLYRVNVLTGEKTLLLQHDRFAEVMVDDAYAVRLGMQMNAEGGADFYIAAGDSAEGWKLWDSIPAADSLTTAPVGFDKTNRILFMKDSRGRDTSAVVEVDLQTRASRVLAVDARTDAHNIIQHPTNRHIQAVSFIYDRKRWEILDPEIQADLEYLRTVADGEVEISSRSLDDRYWTVAYVIDNGPALFYLYDRTSKSTTFLFTNRKDLAGKALAKMRSAVIRSRDGLNLIAYVTLPAGADRDGDGIPDQPLPMVFTPHGGPWHRDYWGYNTWHQWLANRGYAVLSLNFRASTGFGKAFTNAGDRQWGGKIIDDQVDAVRWAIDQKIADRRRVAVMGGSFGGFSTLAGLTFHPDLFACGVDVVGVANLITWIEAIPPYWKTMFELLVKRVGDPTTEQGRAMLREQSPLTHVERITKPLLVAQGANDPRVRKAESDQIVQAMQARKVPVTYLLYPDEGHGFARPENNLAFSAVAEGFLARNLGGRQEPIGNDCQGSSIQVPSGVEDIAGLAEALNQKR